MIEFIQNDVLYGDSKSMLVTYINVGGVFNSELAA